MGAQPCPRRLGVRKPGLEPLQPGPGEPDLLAERKGKELGEGERSQVWRDGEKWGSGDREPGVSQEGGRDSRSAKPAEWKEGGLAERQMKNDHRKGRRGLRKFENATNRAGIQALLAEHI